MSSMRMLYEYKFGFQGQESEDELYGKGNASFFKYRISDNRLGRFFSIDPLAPKYPHNSPYAFSENRVIDGVELEGLEVEVINQTTYTDEITNMTYTFENFNVNYDLPQSNNIILNQIDYTTGLSNTSVLEPAVITPKPSQIQQANNKTATKNALTLNKNKPITPTKSSNICYDCSRFEKSLEGNSYDPTTQFSKDYIYPYVLKPIAEANPLFGVGNGISIWATGEDAYGYKYKTIAGRFAGGLINAASGYSGLKTSSGISTFPEIIGSEIIEGNIENTIQFIDNNLGKK